MLTRWRDLLLPATAVVVLIADQVSKAIILNFLSKEQSWAPIPALAGIFTLTHVTNTGAAFGLFPQLGFLFAVIAVVVVAAILVYHSSVPANQWIVQISLGLQLGGALGNLLDRIRYGYVIDFIHFKFCPVFNLADNAIVAGVAILAWYLLRSDQESRRDTIVIEPELSPLELNELEAGPTDPTEPRLAMIDLIEPGLDLIDSMNPVNEDNQGD
jgi:signal peptidase II